MKRLVVIGGSDAGISASLRAKEIDPKVEVIVVVEADRHLCVGPLQQHAG